MNFDVEIDVPGKFSVYNSMTAISICRHFGVKKEALHLSAEPKKLLLSNMNHTEIGQDIILAPQESAVVLL